MKKIILTVLVIGVLTSIGLGYNYFFRGDNSNFSVVEAKVENLTEKVSVTGTLVPFKRVRIEPKVNEEAKEILVQVSDKVEEGDLLIQLDDQDARIQVNKAQSNVNRVEEEIGLLDTQLENAKKDLEQTKESATQSIAQAENSLEEAETNLEDVEKLANKQLEQAYENGRTTANSTLLTAQTALINLDDIVQDYFSTNDQISLKVRSKQESAESTIEEAEELIEQAEDTKDEEKTKEAIETLEDG